MKTTKFRAWDEKRMYYFDLEGLFNEGCETTLNDSKHLSLNTQFPYINMPVMQFTGLHDKTGKDIYEGDVIKQTAEAYYDEDHIDKTYIGEVVILASKGTCLKRSKCKDNLTGSTYNVDYYVNVAQYRSEVIGNIHEHDHLLVTSI